MPVLLLSTLLVSLPVLAAPDALMLQIHPAAITQQPSSGIRLALIVTDDRPSTIPGLTVDGEALRLANDPAKLIDEAVRQALQRKGYTLASAQQHSQRLLHIQLAALSYQAEKKLLRSDIHVEVVIRAVASRGRHTLNKTFHGKNAYEVALSPSETENSRMLSETLTHALDNMLADPELDEFLRASDMD